MSQGVINAMRCVWKQRMIMTLMIVRGDAIKFVDITDDKNNIDKIIVIVLYF